MVTRTLRDSLRFVSTFVRKPGTVGAVWPSSPRLAQALAGDLGLRPGDVVVEYGPGTGPMTRVVAEQLAAVPSARFLGIELDAGFVDVLRRQHPELDFACGSVVDAARLVKERGLGRARYILSGLPFASLPAVVQEGTIAGVLDVLAPDGEFRTFQYLHAYRLPKARSFRALMAKHFSHFERSRPILRNVPPAFVLTYRR
ncbi:MAG: SAM-dependent methyltransferase [Phycisphaerales bacterium]|nr:SAM-dependent methyltransferase [Phycisphaerales bacterium]